MDSLLEEEIDKGHCQIMGGFMDYLSTRGGGADKSYVSYWGQGSLLLVIDRTPADIGVFQKRSSA